ncbi:MAG: hypothetical protein WA921_02535 [Ahrensia sp.]
MISANEIVQWASTHNAQSELPQLVRRAIGQVGSSTAITMPAGASVTVGGFDGTVFAQDGNAWVPSGKSYWELSVNAKPRTKADSDYQKRTAETSPEERSQSTYIAVTARKWDRRAGWIKEKQVSGEWADVRAYDVDDLELWLEQEYAVQLWFAELLGKPTHAIRSVERYWNDWNRDVVPAISIEAVLASRETEQGRLLELLTERQQGGTIVIHADSVQEAVAFACASIISSDQHHSSRAVVLTQPEAWGAVSANSNIDVAVAGNHAVAQAAPSRDGLLLILPFANGDSEAHFHGHKHVDVDPDIVLQRTLPEDFRKALEEMGIDHGDAQRLALQCGRSWSVYRRLKNNNSALKQPNWSDKRYSTALTTMALVGAFLQSNKHDLAIIETISGITADEFLAQSKTLVRMDDAPFAEIDGVLKAKSTLEVFVLNEEGVSDKMFERFIECCSAVIGQNDPAFELTKDERWLANIHGKVRPHSAILLKSLADALVRISVHTKGDGRRWQIDQLVKRLFENADEARWLSLSPLMRELAEAAPSEFLKALETDLATAKPKVFRLFAESSSRGLGGGSFEHANLLWALEILAWAPHNLVRVSRILSSLQEAPIEANWGNSPQSSLLNIYRSWRPQTSAPVTMRNEAMTALSKTHPDATFNLCKGMLHRGSDMAVPSQRPSWRDDDAGCSETVTNKDAHDVVVHAANLAFSLAGDDAERAIKLFERYDIFDEDYRAQVLSALRTALDNGSYLDVRAIRKSLRKKLHWERNYGGKNREGLNDDSLKAIATLYDESEPSEVIERYQWLFENHYTNLPEEREGGRYEQVENRLKDLRVAAIADIHAELGLEGIERLADEAGIRNCVGYVLHAVDQIPPEKMIEWTAARLASDNPASFMGEWFRSLGDETRAEIIERTIAFGEAKLDWSEPQKLKLLQNARVDAVTWGFVEKLNEDAQASYWRGLSSIPAWLPDEDRKDGVKQLLEHDNSAAVLRSIEYNEDAFTGEEIAVVIERNFASQSDALKEINLHHIQDLIQIMEACPKLERQRLLAMEFRLISAFGQFVVDSALELQRELIENPDQLLFVISKAYKRDGETKEELSEEEQRFATVAHHILLHIKICPGLQRDGAFSELKFREFTQHLKKRAVEEGYTNGMQHVLGKLMAFAPKGENENWPPPCICEVLDLPEHDRLRGSFQTGIYNKRGVTTRLPYDGGDQEREIAQRYDGYAERVQIEFPLASECLKQIAESYRRDATRHDRSAETSKERF